jgi:hypothetical protein
MSIPLYRMIATTRALTIASRIAGGVLIEITSKSDWIGLSYRRRRSSRLTFLASSIHHSIIICDDISCSAQIIALVL